MVVYWTAFLFISYCSVLLSMLNSSSYKMSSSVFNFSIWSFVFCGLLFLVGLRHEVGGDWDQYLSILDSLRNLNEFDTNIINSLLGDPGYQLIMHISLTIGAGIYGVNLLCAIIFLSGLFFFASQLPKPMLAIAVAFPYLILIVGMGYTRQSAGIGLVMASLIYFIRQENLKFILLVIAGALLHKSAIIFLGLMFFNNRKFSFFRTLLKNSHIIYRPHPWRGGLGEGEKNFFDLNLNHISMDPFMSEYYNNQISKPNRKVFMIEYYISNQLLTLADALVSPLSTMLVEAMTKGKPILVFFPKEYTGKGFRTDQVHYADLIKQKGVITIYAFEKLISGLIELTKNIGNKKISNNLINASNYFHVLDKVPYNKKLNKLVSEVYHERNQ